MGGVSFEIYDKLKAENAQMRKEHELWRHALDDMTMQRNRLRAAAERVVWFDWSGNDTDAVAAIDELRSAFNGRELDE